MAILNENKPTSSNMKNINILSRILSLSLIMLIINPSHAQQKTLELGAFKGVKLGLPVELYIKQGSPQNVIIEGPGEAAEHIKTKIHNDMLYIVKQDTDPGWWEKQKAKAEKVKIYITAPNITHLAASDGGSIQSKNTLRAKRLKVDAIGTGTVKVVVEAGDVEGKVSGSGYVGLKGSARNTKFRVSGSSNLDAERLAASNCQVEISGSGNCRIQVSNDLLSRISGNGKVFYRGNPKRIINNASGSGALKKIS